MKDRSLYLMSRRPTKRFLLTLLTLAFLPVIPLTAGSNPLPVRGLNLTAPKPDELPLALRFIRDALPKEGVNVLVMEFDYRYPYKSHPEVVDADALSEDQVKQIVAACHDAGVRLIPLINMLGHQSWDKQTFGLLRAHPEFDEAPGKYPTNQGIYCRSYCPRAAGVHAVVFDLIDELATACQADAVHVGMDEVFLLGEDDCPRCRGMNKAELFAQEVRTLHDHLAGTHREMWMWGDRFLDGDATGLGKWEASINGTAPAISLVPRDIVICDWHYEAAVPTAAYFAIQGFRVVAAPWQMPDVALNQLELVRRIRAASTDALKSRTLGALQTTWCDLGDFVQAYYGEGSPTREGVKAAECFKALFREVRQEE
ncbi:MAG TPA: family 20 glycosylhydrolase [Terriglobia bacterium]|nr:family 20 glycosylhydrolase [Terriglobia bacterium]